MRRSHVAAAKGGAPLFEVTLALRTTTSSNGGALWGGPGRGARPPAPRAHLVTKDARRAGRGHLVEPEAGAGHAVERDAGVVEHLALALQREEILVRLAGS